MTFCVGAGYMLALCPINKVNQEGRVERNRLYQAIVFSIILVYVVIGESNSSFMSCPTDIVRFSQWNNSCLNTYWGLS